jgi:hypothetical protein
MKISGSYTDQKVIQYNLKVLRITTEPAFAPALSEGSGPYGRHPHTASVLA